MRAPTLAWLAGSLVVFCSAGALAHIQLTFPAARTAAQKYGPCGGVGSVRGDVVTSFAPGETIVVTWKETIGHPGHYRVSFDPDGQDDFVDPASFDDLYTAPSVLLDDIADKPGTTAYTAEITLPDIECDNCTLQLIQVMTDKPPYGDGNDLYYQCADVVLTSGSGSAGAAGSGAAGEAGFTGAGGVPGAGGTPGTGASGGAAASAGNGSAADESDGGCGCKTRSARGHSSNLLALAALGLLAARRRRGPHRPRSRGIRSSSAM
jgi:MYXO-CTERM domain-containing protein